MPHKGKPRWESSRLVLRRSIHLIEFFGRDSGPLARVPMALTALLWEQLCREVSSSSIIIPGPTSFWEEFASSTACSQACHVDLNKKDSWRERKQSFSFVVSSFLITVAVKICSLLCPLEAQAIRLKDGVRHHNLEPYPGLASARSVVSQTLPQSRERKVARDCEVHRDTCCIGRLSQKSKKIWHSASQCSRQVNSTVQNRK